MFLVTEFQREVLHMLTACKYELRRIVSNQRDIVQRLDYIDTRLDNPVLQDPVSHMPPSSLNDIAGCSLPLDNITDLDTLENKIAGDGAFRFNLVCNLKLQYIKSI